MATPTLAIYLFGYNLERILYPWRESIRSALALADAVYFCECLSEDDTWYQLHQEFGADIAAGRLRTIQHPWGDHHSVQAHIGNMLLDEIGSEFDYALKLDADEVLCEWTFPTFREDLAKMAKTGALLGRPRYVHFCPDFQTTFPFIYDSKAVISACGVSALRYNVDPDEGNADACALGGAPEFQTSLLVHHFGKVHTGRREAALYKEQSFQQLYVDLGFPDPKVVAQSGSGYLDYWKVFDIAADRGDFRPYSGPHPKWMEGYIRAAIRRETQWHYERTKAVTNG